MTNPITPPPKLLNILKAEWSALNVRTKGELGEYLVANAYRAGADQELEACCKWLQCEAGNAVTEFIPGDLRAARRPQLPPETIKVDGHTYQLVK